MSHFATWLLRLACIRVGYVRVFQSNPIHFKMLLQKDDSKSRGKKKMGEGGKKN